MDNDELFSMTEETPASEELVPRLGRSQKNSKQSKAKNNKGNKTKKKKNIVYDIAIIVCVIVFGISAYYLGSWMWENHKAGKVANEAKEKGGVETETVQTKGGKVIAGMDGDDADGKLSYLNLNMDELYAVNSDTRGWIRVNGTLVDYPVVQCNNNDYYLTHDFEENYNDAGCPFMDYRNNGKNLRANRNVVIYGHARKDRSMFGSLDYCRQSWWLNEPSFPIVRYTTLDEKTVWKIFSVYTINVDEYYYIQTEFGSDSEFMSFVNDVKSFSEHDFGVEVTADDTIMTLSTCAYNGKDRLVVHAKLVQAEPR